MGSVGPDAIHWDPDRRFAEGPPRDPQLFFATTARASAKQRNCHSTCACQISLPAYVKVAGHETS